MLALDCEEYPCVAVLQLRGPGEAGVVSADEYADVLDALEGDGLTVVKATAWGGSASVPKRLAFALAPSEASEAVRQRVAFRLGKAQQAHHGETP